MITSSSSIVTSAAADAGLQRQSYSPVDPAFEPGQYRSGAPFLASAAAEVNWTQAGHAFARTGSQVGSGKVYELRDHLGNVHAVVGDRKLPLDDDSDGIAEGFAAQVVSARDFYPYGMVMAGRKQDVPGYRYGFNGKEMDDEVKGAGLQVDFGARGYDPRLGQWMAVDQIIRPTRSPFVGFGSSPISRLDPNGMDDYFAPDGRYLGTDGKSTTKIRIVTGKIPEDLLYHEKSIPAEDLAQLESHLVVDFIDNSELSTRQKISLSESIISYYAREVGVNGDVEFAPPKPIEEKCCCIHFKCQYQSVLGNAHKGRHSGSNEQPQFYYKCHGP